jgi:hypothetical protein
LQPLTDAILETCQAYLGCSTKENGAAAESIARLLTRSDAIKTHLPKFIDWSIRPVEIKNTALANFHVRLQRDIIKWTLEIQPVDWSFDSFMQVLQVWSPGNHAYILAKTFTILLRNIDWKVI